MSVHLRSQFRFHVKTIQHSFIWIRHAHPAVNRKWTTGCFVLEMHWRKNSKKVRLEMSLHVGSRRMIKCWLWLWTSLSVSKFLNVSISAIQTKMQPWSFPIETKVRSWNLELGHTGFCGKRLTEQSYCKDLSFATQKLTKSEITSGS